MWKCLLPSEIVLKNYPSLSHVLCQLLFQVAFIWYFLLIINLSSNVRKRYSLFSACQFKSKNFFIFHCCPPSKIGFRALLSHCIYKALLQLVLGNNLYEMCGCIIFTFMIPSHQFFSHTSPAGTHHLRATHLLLAWLSYSLSPCSGSWKLPFAGHSLCLLFVEDFFSFLFCEWKGTITTLGMMLVLLKYYSQHLLRRDRYSFSKHLNLFQEKSQILS